MTRPRIGRHLAALVVPFNADSSIDEASFRKLCQYMLAVDGIDGLVVNANAGEVDALTEEERVHVLRMARDEAHAAGKLVVGGVVPFPGTNVAAARTAKTMEAEGADALLLLGPPSFGRGVDAMPEVAGEYAHDVASAVKVPIIYFMQGPMSGINYTPETVKQICSVDNIVAIKDTMWTPLGFDTNLKLLRKLGRDTVVLSGNDNCLFHNFASGAHGTLLVLHLVMARAILEMERAVLANDLNAARAIHERHEALVGLLFARPMLKMASRVKFALKQMGVIATDLTRAPVPVASAEEGKAIAAQLAELGISR
ncbi:4-hydroxy-tetrahydrodipicolinate synthase [Xylophilus ampelinus]|nr:4-hydroxy-tetrahydrodipicolinate synthase [Xylophilus ampelinus]